MRRLNYNYVFYFYSKASRIDYSLLIERDISKKLDLNFFAQSIDSISKYKEDEDVFKKCFQIQLPITTGICL